MGKDKGEDTFSQNYFFFLTRKDDELQFKRTKEFNHRVWKSGGIAIQPAFVVNDTDLRCEWQQSQVWPITYPRAKLLRSKWGKRRELSKQWVCLCCKRKESWNAGFFSLSRGYIVGLSDFLDLPSSCSRFACAGLDPPCLSLSLILHSLWFIFHKDARYIRVRCIPARGWRDASVGKSNLTTWVGLLRPNSHKVYCTKP